MVDINKKALSERDICTKYVTPALANAGWDVLTQIREEVAFTRGKIIVKGKTVRRGKPKRADYILYYKSNIPLAVIEAKDNNHSVGAGMQQALDYSDSLDLPFVFSTNGDAFVFHDKTVTAGEKERQLALDAFPSPAELWRGYCVGRGINSEAEKIVTQEYYTDTSGKQPHYYQAAAVNAVVNGKTP
jgi:type I restriction enzyme R subunit